MTRPTHASPNISYKDVDLTQTNDRIRVFEDRVRTLLLAHARALLQRPDGQFAALQLVLPYFESIHSYRTGQDSRGRSAEFFRRGFLRVFSGPIVVTPASLSLQPDFMLELADTVYAEARCGLFHDGLTRYRIAVLPTPGIPPIDAALGSDGILRVTIGASGFRE